MYIEPYPDIFRTLRNPCIYSCPIFRTLTHLEPKTSSKACLTFKMIRHIQNENSGIQYVDKSDVESLYKISEFTFENRSGDGGGVAAYISNNIKWERREDLEDKNIECLWLEIFPPKTKSYYLCVMYRPPDTSDYLPSDFNEVFTNMLSVATKDSKECILTGDVNVNF